MSKTCTFCPKADGFLSPNKIGAKAKHKRETIRPSLFLETLVLTEETPDEETDRTRAHKVCTVQKHILCDPHRGKCATFI